MTGTAAHDITGVAGRNEIGQGVVFNIPVQMVNCETAFTNTTAPSNRDIAPMTMMITRANVFVEPKSVFTDEPRTYGQWVVRMPNTAIRSHQSLFYH